MEDTEDEGRTGERSMNGGEVGGASVPSAVIPFTVRLRQLGERLGPKLYDVRRRHRLRVVVLGRGIHVFLHVNRGE